MTTSEEIGARIRLVRAEMGLSQKAMADLAGMSLRTWQGIEQGRNVPSGETLLRFDAVGYNPGWILSGLGPKKLNGKPQSTTEDMLTFAQFLPEIADAIQAAYREAGGRLNGNDLMHATSHWFLQLHKIARDIGDIEELRSLLPWVAAQVKKEIADANAGLGKRAASD